MTRRMSDGAPKGHDNRFDPSLAPMVAAGVAELVPHNRALGIKLVGLSEEGVTLGFPWNEKLIGNPDNRVLHGGAITALMDATCGTAVILALLEPVPIATLDLRIDYLKPARPDQDVHARARCFKVARNVAFVRCEAFHPDDPKDLIAVANGTFMIFRGKTRRKMVGV